MADYERSVLEHYQLSTPFPTTWPANKNEHDSDDSGNDKTRKKKKNSNNININNKNNNNSYNNTKGLQRRKSRYQALERTVTNRRSFVPGSESTDGGGVGNLVAKDEPDPLGTSDSVVRMLQFLGMEEVKDDVRLRNRFLLSSTTFQPSLFLSQVHANADTTDLLRGLDVLSQSIDQKSASLKVLVETNFERFVKAKATIDNVYREMKYHGVDPAAAAAAASVTSPTSRARAHSRHASRSSFRNSVSGSIPGLGVVSPLATPFPAAATAAASDARKKNALVKESEYGVAGIKAPLLEVSAKAEDVWGPALGGREKEEHLRTLAAQLDRFRDQVELGAAVADSIKRRDYESLVDEYTRARRFADDARRLAAEIGKAAPTDQQLHQMILAARVWNDVDEQIQAFKRDVWRRLTSAHGVSLPSAGASHSGSATAATAAAAAATATAPSSTQDHQHMELISLLLELGVDDNPVWVWLLSRYDFLKGKIGATADRTKVEIEVLRRRLANGEKPGPQAVAVHILTLGRHHHRTTTGAAAINTAGTTTTATNTTATTPASVSAVSSAFSVEGRRSASLDAPEVIELWEKMLGFLSALLSSYGILGEVLEFWQTVQGFVDGRTQMTLPVGYNGESRRHHQLADQGVADLSRGAVELVDMIRDHVFSFFAGLPPDDISLLFSPLPQSPATATSPRTAGPNSPSLAGRDPRFNLDAGSVPQSPKLGEPWEKTAFWPPWSNSISGVHYLSRMLTLVGSGASDMASIEPVQNADGPVLERLRSLVGAARERCVTAICAAWNRDAENIRWVEDWQRVVDSTSNHGTIAGSGPGAGVGTSEVTRMPAAFQAFEGALLSGMQRILYLSEAMDKPGAGDIVLPPQTKLLQMVRSQYVTTLYKALSGMVENAERLHRRTDDDWTTDVDGTAVSAAARTTTGGGRVMLDATDRNVRMLITLSNLQALRTVVVPALNLQFENAFSVKLTDESKTIKDVLGQIDARLFQSYTRPSVERLRTLIRAGISDPAWAPPATAKTKPAEARPYVYETLLALVLVHSQVSAAAPALASQVLSYLLEQVCRELLDAFRARPATTRFPLASLMQATLDVEFVAQTLNQYTTDRASELQGQIYAELDGRTDDDARARLQAELPEMRAVLKRLREASRNEFACFRKLRRQGTGT